jgi:hypothetical protein
MIIKEKQVTIIRDSLRIYVAFLSEEYQHKPSLTKARAMNDAVETLDLFINPKKPKSKVQKQVERVSKNDSP